MLSTASAPPPDIRDELQARIQSMQATRLEERVLPMLPLVAGLIPGGLRQGSVYSVTGSTTLAMAMLAAPSADGAWCGVLGLPHFGTEAAAGWGIDLDRLVLVPTPGQQWMTVAAAMTDVLGVVVASGPTQVSAAEASRLSARLRQRGSTLLVLGEWPGADARLRVTDSSWRGLGDGHGHLTERQLEVETRGHNSLGRPHHSRFALAPGVASAGGVYPAADQHEGPGHHRNAGQQRPKLVG